MDGTAKSQNWLLRDMDCFEDRDSSSSALFRSWTTVFLKINMDSTMYGNCPQQFGGGFLNPATAAMIAAATTHRQPDGHYGSGLDQQQQPDHQQQTPYVSAAAYAAAAGFGAFLNPQQRGGNPNMDTYPLTAHMQSENSPGNTYVTPSYDGYPTYYQHYQAIQSPASFQGNYVIQTQQNSPVSADGDDAQSALSHTARTSPETLVWLSENYEPCEGSSLPRCTLYNHYKRHCAECGIDPVNPASFGKLIRSVFRGLKTRRLGTRGNSKYHYYGIRIKPNSTFLLEMENDRGMHHPRHQRRNELHSSNPYHTRAATAAATNSVPIPTSDRQPAIVPPTPTAQSGSINSHRSEYASGTSPNGVSTTNGSLETADREVTSEVLDSYSELMGPAQVPTINVPNFQDLEPFLVTVDLELSQVNHFIEVYIATWVETIHLTEQLRFKLFEEVWINFWQKGKDRKLTQGQSFQIVSFEQISKFIEHVDQLFYQAMVDILMPNVLNPVSNSKYATTVRNFAKQVPSVMKKALVGGPPEFVSQKMASVRAFAHRLKRYTSIHHLAHAARAVLDQPKQIDQMYTDFCRIDVTSIQEQAGWVCECDPLLFQSIFNAFKSNLELKRNLEGWADWMEAVVDQALANSHDKSLEIQAEKSKNMVLIWSYFGTAIIRDLTLRSADSFGSFHLLKMLFDDYIFHLVELRLAKVANTPVVCLLSKNWIGNSHFDHTIDLEDQVQPIHMVVHDPISTSTNIQYVVTSSDPKYVFAPSNEIIVTSNTGNSYVMVPSDTQYHHQLITPNSNQLETIVYVDENGQQTTPDNSQAQYIVMTAPVSTQSEIQQIRQETNTCSRRNSFEENSPEKQARTADDLVLSGDILEADLDSPCQEK